MRDADMPVSRDIAESASAPLVEVSRLDKWFGAVQVLRSINLNVSKRERIVICGPSGSGKFDLNPLHQRP